MPKMPVPIAPFGGTLLTQYVLHYCSTTNVLTSFSDIYFSRGRVSGDFYSTRQPHRTFSVLVDTVG